MSDWTYADAAHTMVVGINPGNGFTETRPIADLPEGTSVDPFVAPPAPVPQSVTMRQARRALHAAGMLGAIEAAINAMPEPNRTAARIEWDYSSEVQRHNAFVGVLASALGLDDAALDALFVAAKAIA